MLASLQSLFGLAVIVFAAWVLCRPADRLAPSVALRIAAVGIALQFTLAALLLLVPQLRIVFDILASAVAALQTATLKGMRFAFGYLAGAPFPFDLTHPENGFVLALQALPLVLLVSVLSKLLYHWGILQIVVRGFAWVLERTMRVSGALGTATAANIFVGMVEAPLFIRPYLRDMSRGDLFATMTAGMATVAGTVMALYASILAASLPGAAGHIMIASVMSAPAALVISRLMVPDRSVPDQGPVSMSTGDEPRSAMDAIAQGMVDGIRLLAYVIAMLVIMVALVALLDMMLAALTEPFGVTLTVAGMLGVAAAPVAWLIGIPWSEAVPAGELLGIKTVLNEFLAYVTLAEMPDTVISERSRLILTYALCGFANFGSLGIMTGGLVAMCPERRDDILSLGPLTLVSGTLSTLMTGAVIGALTPA